MTKHFIFFKKKHNSMNIELYLLFIKAMQYLNYFDLNFDDCIRKISQEYLWLVCVIVSKSWRRLATKSLYHCQNWLQKMSRQKLQQEITRNSLPFHRIWQYFCGVLFRHKHMRLCIEWFISFEILYNFTMFPMYFLWTVNYLITIWMTQ